VAQETSLSTVVLDASAVLAAYFDEPGAEIVRPTLLGALLSAVNYSEVIGKCLDRGDTLAVTLRKLAATGVTVAAYDARLAQRAGELRPLGRRWGLSLGDRACLALAEREGVPVLTADRSWKALPLVMDIRLIR
jgi:PIN domain nuclease of toxin-antitoxin system